MSGWELFVFGLTAVASTVLIVFGVQGYRNSPPDARQKPMLMIAAGVVAILNLFLWYTMPAPPTP